MTTRSAPSNFNSFWSAVMSELDATPIAAELNHMPLHSTEFSTLRGARLTSIGPYRIFAYYSVPNHVEGTGKPLPAVVNMPGYGSVTHVSPYEYRQRYITLALRHRGQRHADQPYAAAYPGLLTDGIENPESYIYRGIVADCCRVVDFLLSRPEVDANRVALVGNDLALIAAALRPQVDALYCTPSLFYRASELAAQTDAYPLEELNDYARAYPDRASAMHSTLAYFDPIHFASRLQARTLLVTGNEQDLLSPAVMAPLVEAIGGNVETYESAHSSYKDGVNQEAWLRNHYGFAEPLLPAQWQGQKRLENPA